MKRSTTHAQGLFHCQLPPFEQKLGPATDPGHELQRHKQPSALTRERELVVACVPMRSHVNVSQIARSASACAIARLILTGNARLKSKIARDAVNSLDVSIHRTLHAVLRKLRQQGFHLVGLEQATHSKNLHHYRFQRRSVLVIGNERLGLTPDILDLLDEVVEIPVYGLPHSYNVASATDMALYEYCRQFPQG